MSRYLERAEHTARVFNVQLNLMLERGTGSDDRHWLRVLRSLGVEMTGSEAEHAKATAQAVTHDASRASSTVGCIMAARENARQVREEISSEMWEQLNRLFHEVKGASAEEPWADGPIRFLETIKEGAHLFHGITDSTMTHGDGWQFIQVGRFLERARTVSTLVDGHFRAFDQSADAAESEHLEWIGLLRSCTAFEAYCKAYTADLRPDRIAEFLVLHPNFPHSIRFSADALDAALQEIGGEVSGQRTSRVDRIAGRLRATLGYGQIDEIMSTGLHAYLDTVLRQCVQVHSAVHSTYIKYPIEMALGA
jgi:uncharacterized alpha-E superfamily protein